MDTNLDNELDIPTEMPALENAGQAPAPIEEAPSQESPELYPVPAPPKKRIRPEWILGALAVIAAGLLIAALTVSLPYMEKARDEDPEDLPNVNAKVELPIPETILEPTEETEQNPTIPPDPNPYDRYSFQFDRNNHLLLQNLPSYPGVDVSAHQGAIDWKAVKRSGIHFAMVRLGYRGYGSGKLVEDEYVEENLRGASDAGLKLGAYFFSQALSIAEADEEIDFMLEILGEHHLDMPIVLDWEIPAADARTAGMDARTLTDIQLHFIQVMKEKGYQPMVYFNWHQSENLYYLSELEEAPFWLALYQYRMTYPWKVEMWQYSCTGRVPGIQGDVDLNVWMPD